MDEDESPQPSPPPRLFQFSLLRLTTWALAPLIVLGYYQTIGNIDHLPMTQKALILLPVIWVVGLLLCEPRLWWVILALGVPFQIGAMLFQIGESIFEAEPNLSVRYVLLGFGTVASYIGCCGYLVAENRTHLVMGSMATFIGVVFVICIGALP